MKISEELYNYLVSTNFIIQNQNSISLMAMNDTIIKLVQNIEKTVYNPKEIIINDQYLPIIIITFVFDYEFCISNFLNINGISDILINQFSNQPVEIIDNFKEKFSLN